jgi:hypothetical protein
MLLNLDTPACTASLRSIIQELEVHEPSTSFGEDIDAAHAAIFGTAVTATQRARFLLDWIARFQPCLFGRLGAKELEEIGIDLIWVDENDINLGDYHVITKIQRARRSWKDRTSCGSSHGLLIMFNHPRLAFARPSSKLLSVCQRIADMYLVEHAPVLRDVIYTEAIPLLCADGLSLFKAGINLFYPSAHRTLNHDRRIPGGVMISVNSPGHYANSMVVRGIYPTLDSAVEHVMNLTLRSIGNGGIGHTGTPSCSWHNRELDPMVRDQRPIKRLPSRIPADHSRRNYSALYHTDVLVPTEVTTNGCIDPETALAETWSHLRIDYVTTRRFPPEHVNYGLFRGHPISEEARYHNPWPPRRAVNARCPSEEAGCEHESEREQNAE